MNKRLLILPAVLGALTAVAYAAPSSRVAWTPATLALVKNADADHGLALASSLACDGCHTGNAMPEAPHINGQTANYLYRQLHDYQDGSRAHAIMSGVAKGLREQDMADLAAWYAKQDALPPVSAKGDVGKAEVLAEHGDNQRLIPACAACHGGNGAGKGQDVPRLAGQKPAYLAAMLRAYKTGQRHNDVYQRMRSLAAVLSEEEIKQLAEYYGELR
ncbi:MAG: c-type cytochrome [Methylococcaceae bacterium]|nr:MAG: c-type cytochrome [Methylococcaceae bacterium]